MNGNYPAPYEHGSETGRQQFDIPMLLYCNFEIPALNRSRERERFSSQM
jgi:hypothetical protein